MNTKVSIIQFQPLLAETGENVKRLQPLFDKTEGSKLVILPGLSLMNRIYIATANRIGTERGITFNGSSLFTDPAGRIIKESSADKSEIITIEIDTQLSGNKMITPRNHVFNDRRPDVYLP